MADWLDRTGATRAVIIGRRYVYKLPNLFDGWRLFLCGLLANMQERQFGRQGWDGVCPVVFSLPGGWLGVMNKARVMTRDEFEAFDWQGFCEREQYTIPAEGKWNSYGFLDGQTVAIDYGS